jgi:hypothetical protein
MSPPLLFANAVMPVRPAGFGLAELRVRAPRSDLGLTSRPRSHPPCFALLPLCLQVICVANKIDVDAKASTRGPLLAVPRAALAYPNMCGQDGGCGGGKAGPSHVCRAVTRGHHTPHAVLTLACAARYPLPHAWSSPDSFCHTFSDASRPSSGSWTRARKQDREHTRWPLAHGRRCR